MGSDGKCRGFLARRRRGTILAGIEPSRHPASTESPHPPRLFTGRTPPAPGKPAPMQILEQFQEPIGLLLRWSHILAAITALGGLIFSRFALLPALEDLDEEARNRVHDGIRRSWMKWVMGSITILLLTGLANYLLTINRASTEAWGGNGRMWMKSHGYHAFMGAKILFAFALFYLASALIGRGEATQWARDDRKKWLTITLGLGLAVVILSGYLRQMHTGPNTVAAAGDGERLGGGGEEGPPRGGFGGGMMGGGGMMDDEFGGGGSGGGGRGRGPRGGDTPPPDEGNPEPEAKPPAAPDAAAAAPTSEPVPPPDEGEPEPGADTPAAAK